MKLRCAVYARFSSDRQSPTSIEDQIRKCREHAAREGWEVLEEHVYFDDAVGGGSKCTNALLVRRDELERDLLRGLSESVLRTEVVDYLLARLQEELRKDHERLDSWRKGLGAEKQRIESELKRLVEMIAVGNGSPTIMADITEREARLKGILNQLVEPGPGSLQEKLDELRELRFRGLQRFKSCWHTRKRSTKPTRNWPSASGPSH